MRINGEDFIARVFLVLSLVSRAKDPLSLHDVTTSTELPKPTVLRLLRALESLGYIASTREGNRYRTTAKVFELIPTDDDARLKEKALPLMATLHRDLNETINLGRFEDGQLRYVHSLESTRELRWIPDNRRHEELLHTALGRVIAAFNAEKSGDMSIEELCRRAGYNDPLKIERELKSIKRKGWALEENQSCDGVSCFAAPLFLSGKVIAAISVSVPNVRVDSGGRTIVKALKDIPNSLDS
tara:strand:- start:1307 stop:2032 length:726 start_codon:yes stop_codon:yes gene_type:complete